jgi:hypothetical protein
MKLQFNAFGFIVCYEFFEDSQYISHVRFDTKKAALNFVRENPEMRGVCAECVRGN